MLFTASRVEKGFATAIPSNILRPQIVSCSSLEVQITPIVDEQKENSSYEAHEWDADDSATLLVFLRRSNQHQPRLSISCRDR